MIKAILILLFCLPFLAFPPEASSTEPNGVASAIEAVRSFYDEAYPLIKDLPGKEAEALRYGALERKALAEGELNALAMTETPSRARFRKAYKVAEDYTGWVTGTLGDLKARSKQFEAAYDKAAQARHRNLEKLKDAFKYEAAFEKKRPKEVPIIDRSPFEAPPEETPGMWYR